MIVTEHFAVCDVCSERIGPFDTVDKAREASEGWLKVIRGIIQVQAHTFKCAKIALDDESMFNNWESVGMARRLRDLPPAPSIDLTGALGGSYMERMAQGAEVFSDIVNGKHGEKEK